MPDLKFKQPHSYKASYRDPLDDDLFRRIAENSLSGIALIDENLELVYANPAMIRIHGYDSFEGLKKGSLLNTVAPESMDTVMQRVREWKQGRSSSPYLLYKIVRKDGEARDLETLSSDIVLGERHYLLNSVIDITDRLKAQEELKGSRERYRLHFDNVHEIIFSIDQDLRFLDISSSVEKMLGYRPEELEGRPLWSLEFFTSKSLEKAYFNAREAFGRQAIPEQEYEVITRDGRSRVLAVSAKPLIENGKVTRIFSVARDITERKRAEQAIRESEERFRAIFDTARDCIFIKDTEFKYAHANPAMEKLFEMPASQIIGKGDDFLFGEEAGAYLREVDSRVLRGEVVEDREHEKSVKGEPRVFHSIKAPMRDARGEVVGICGIARDVTELKRVEKALQDSEERHRLLAENTEDVIWAKDLDMNNVFVSSSVERLLGYSVEEHQQGKLQDILTPESYELAIKTLAEALEEERGRKPGEPPVSRVLDFQYRRKDGSLLWCEVKTNFMRDRDGNITGIQGVSRDVTERKLAEQALYESEQRYERLVNSSGDAIAIHSRGEILFANQAAAREAGADSPDELVGKSIFEFVHPDFREAVLERVKQMMEQGRAAPVIEEKLLKSDGTEVPAEVMATPVFYKGKMASQVVVRDISKRKEAEDASKRSEERFRSVIENSPDMLTILDEKGFIKYASPANRKVHGFSETELVGRPLQDSIHPDDLPVVEESFQRLLEKPGLVETIEFRLRHKDGSFRFIEGHGKNMLDHPAVQGIVCNARDTTDRKEAEQELEEQKDLLEAVVDNVSDGVFVLDQNANYVMINHACGKIVGLVPDDWIDKPGGSHLHPEDLSTAATCFSKAISGEKQTCRLRVRGSDRSYRTLVITLTGITRQGKKHVLGAVVSVET